MVRKYFRIKINWITPLHEILRREYSIHYCGNVCRTYEPALYRQCLSVCMQKVVLSFLRHFLVCMVIPKLVPSDMMFFNVLDIKMQVTNAEHYYKFLSYLQMHYIFPKIHFSLQNLYFLIEKGSAWR